jgi:hypothetical protein
MTLAECADALAAGFRVIYSPFNPDDPEEAGVITSVGETFAHVRYGADLGSRATNPERLSLAGYPAVTG